MSDRPTLAAERRSITGKAVQRLRRAGRLPAVVYGRGVDSEALTIDAREFDDLRRHAGPNVLVDLRVAGSKARPVLVHSVAVHPVTRRPIHADLFAVRMTEEMIVDVPLVAVGTSIAVDQHGGTLLHGLESVRVRALPAHLPQAIEFDVSGLVDFEGSIHVRDLAIPGDATLLTDGDELVARVQAPRVEAEEAPAEAAEAPAAASGEAAASEGGSESADGEASGG